MITTVLFDLDGTLLPMDQDKFVHSYFRRMAAKVAPLGYEPKALVDGIWAGTAAMVNNDGSRTNEEAFWACFTKQFGEKALAGRPVFDEYYRVEFQQVKADCGYNPEAARTVARLKEQGYRVALATNPIFPAVATESRIRWAGLSPEDFLFYTTYENSTHCKPNPAYYEDVLLKLGCPAQECLMVGNDAQEDMAAAEIGMKVFLLTDCLINSSGKDLSAYPQGSFQQLQEYIASL